MIVALPRPTTSDPKLTIIGDFNTDLSPVKVAPSPLLRRIAKEWAFLHPHSPTRRGHSQPRMLDGAIVPPCALPNWSVSAHWTTLSDHALLTFRHGPTTAANDWACSLARYWQLPEEAKTALRRAWGCVATALGVPNAEGVTNVLPHNRRQQPEETATDDPIQGLLEPEPSPDNARILNLVDNHCPSRHGCRPSGDQNS